MKSITLILGLVMTIFLISSCGKKSDLGKLIPANAAGLVVLNTSNLSSKVDLGELKQGSFFNKLNADSANNKILNEVLNDPSKTGIDLKENLAGFYSIDSLGASFTLTGKIADSEKFKAFFTSVLQGGKLTAKDNINYLVKDMYTISWKNDRFYAIMIQPEAQPRFNDYLEDSITTNPIKNYRDGTPVASALFNLKTGNSLESNEALNDVLQNKADFYFWVNVSQIQTANSNNSPVGMLNISKLTNNSFYTGTANFENGKIVMDLSSYSGKELSEIWSDYSGENIDTEIMKKTPVKKVAFTAMFNFKPEGLSALLELTGMEGMANMVLAQAGLTADDFIKANKGNIYVSIGDFTKDSTNALKPKGVFVSGIGDKNSFNKLIGIAKGSLGKMIGSNFEYAMNDNYFALGTEGYAAAFIAGKSMRDDILLDKIEGGPIGGYADLQYILSALKDIRMQNGNYSPDDSLNVTFWKDVIFNGGNFKDGAIRQHVEINLIDGNTNSLKQLHTYTNKMSSFIRNSSDSVRQENSVLQ